MALRCTGFTSALASVVKKAKISVVISPSLTFRTLVQLVHRPAKHSSGRLSSVANHTGTVFAVDDVVFGKRIERHQATVLGA